MTLYRTDRGALEARLAELQAELEETGRDLAALEGARARQLELERELTDVTERLARRRGRPDLDDLRIATPCDAKWDDMAGDDRVRFCGACAKHVYDLSKMTRAAAEDLLAANDELPCLRLWRRADGTLLTADCPVGRRRRRFRKIVATSIGGGLVAGALLLRWRNASTVSSPLERAAVAAAVDTATSRPAPRPAPTTVDGEPVYVEGPGGPARYLGPLPPPSGMHVVDMKKRKRGGG